MVLKSVLSAIALIQVLCSARPFEAALVLWQVSDLIVRLNGFLNGCLSKNHKCSRLLSGAARVEEGLESLCGWMLVSGALNSCSCANGPGARLGICLEFESWFKFRTAEGLFPLTVWAELGKGPRSLE
jgi:hypothetical protein